MDFIKTYKCPNCSSILSEDLSDSIIDSSSDEREMGTETEYTIEHECTCDNCDKDCVISGSIWEYPAGAENMDETSIDLKD